MYLQFLARLLFELRDLGDDVAQQRGIVPIEGVKRGGGHVLGQRKVSGD
jgi:hypothetical protein